MGKLIRREGEGEREGHGGRKRDCQDLFSLYLFSYMLCAFYHSDDLPATKSWCPLRISSPHWTYSQLSAGRWKTNLYVSLFIISADHTYQISFQVGELVSYDLMNLCNSHGSQTKVERITSWLGRSGIGCPTQDYFVVQTIFLFY